MKYMKMTTISHVFFCRFSSKATEFPDEIVNALAFFEDFLHYSKLSRKVIHFHFDTGNF